MENKNYYLGLDIGTNSVGYAVATPTYALMKHGGEPMWGAHLFEAANASAERRGYRTTRRRYDRRQFRVRLLQELFALEIGKSDPNFFIRRKESALYKEDRSCGVRLFDGDGITDEAYHEKYPTIHHLIVELMESDEPHDIRLIYMACAWLVANRGHFLLDTPAGQTEQLLDFGKVYQEFCDYFQEREYSLPWSDSVTPDTILDIMKQDVGVKKKESALFAALYNGKKPGKDFLEDCPFNREDIVSLLAGGTAKTAGNLFATENEAYTEIKSISLQKNDEDFAQFCSELEEADSELLQSLRKLNDCAQLNRYMKNAHGDAGHAAISVGKVAIYAQHKQDLKTLKYFVKKYAPKSFHTIFRNNTADNYAAYSRHVKSMSEIEARKLKFCNKDTFSKFILGQVKRFSVEEADEPQYRDMISRLEAGTFLPKQKDGDNRVIPQQLYRYELEEILKRAEKYCPLLSETDENQLTVADKILSIFDFKIPYYVGPLYKTETNHAWIQSKSGRILPWNFAQMVDLDASEEAFIRQMTNKCTYLPEEDVLPVQSLLYEKYMVLNELNNLKVNGVKIPVAVKQEIYREVFQKNARVTVKSIAEELKNRGHCTRQDEISGLDTTIKSTLKSYHIFRRMLDAHILTEDDVERIIQRATLCEEKSRLRKWLEKEFPALPQEDIAYILKQKFKEFGRLSAKFLTGIYGSRTGDDTGEVFTIMDALWETNCNLMQLLSEEYTFMAQVQAAQAESYDANLTLNERLDRMYISNAVKRPIIRALEIVSDVAKANGGAPAKIFLEMERGAKPEEKNNRTKSRKAQILECYERINTQDSRRLTEELEKMGAMADNRLQSERLFLYYLQLGKSVYTGEPIDLSRISDGTYNRDHIYPRNHVKDDSVWNNLVLVESEINGRKQDEFPLSAEIRNKMTPFWQMLKNAGLMSDEKFRRLTRNHPFTSEEKMGFINRQLVETRQSTKVLKQLLEQRFPETEIVCVKAGLVSEYRQEFNLPKSRSVNDLHHAKDAYLNIVVGNVYHERFTKKWFMPDSAYNVQLKKIFDKPEFHGQSCYWNGMADVARVHKTMQKNAVHLTRYTFGRKGQLFARQPVKKAENYIPRKADLPTEKYGGYNKPTAVFYALARFEVKKNHEVMFVPINLMDVNRFLQSAQGAKECVQAEIRKITGKAPQNMELLFGGKPILINTVISLDNAKVTLACKKSGGTQIGVSPLMPLAVGERWEAYIKAMEAFQNKQKLQSEIVLDERFDHISPQSNLALYDLLTRKMGQWPFSKQPNNQTQILVKGREKFESASTEEQVSCLMNLLILFNGGSGGTNLALIGGGPNSGVTRLSASVSNWKKSYSDVRIVHQSPSGLYESRSENLLELL